MSGQLKFGFRGWSGIPPPPTASVPCISDNEIDLVVIRLCITAKKLKQQCIKFIHDDVIKWKKFRVTGPLCGEFTGHRLPVNSPHKGVGRGALMISLIGTWTNGWVNNRDAGDLRRHRAHYYVTVMCIKFVKELIILIHRTRYPWRYSLTKCSKTGYVLYRTECDNAPQINFNWSAKM